jgi:hypothetical protein
MIGLQVNEDFNRKPWRKMMKRKVYEWKSVMVSIVLLTGGVGCKTSTPHRVMSLSPASASPGMTIELKTDGPVAGLGSSTRVLMGKQVVSIQQVTGNSEAEILVPSLTPGKVQVRLQEKGKRAGVGVPFEVLPANAIQVVLSWHEGDVKQVSVTPRGSQYASRVDPGQRRLSYDVYNEKGGLVFSGEMIHPMLGHAEVFDEPEPGKKIIRGAQGHKDNLIILKVPNIPGQTFTIKFFEAPPNADLRTVQGRDQRKYVNEIKIKR